MRQQESPSQDRVMGGNSQTSQASLTAEEKFKSGLEDVLAILERLGPNCQSVEELYEMIKLAVGTEQIPANSGQVRLLMKMMKQPR